MSVNIYARSRRTSVWTTVEPDMADESEDGYRDWQVAPLATRPASDTRWRRVSKIAAGLVAVIKGLGHAVSWVVISCLLLRLSWWSRWQR